MSSAQLFVDGNGRKWKDKNKEVLIAGKFYEVIAVKNHGEMCEVFLLEDEEENKLFEKFFVSHDHGKRGEFSFITLLRDVNFMGTQTPRVAPCSGNALGPLQFSGAHLPEGFVSTGERPPCTA